MANTKIICPNCKKQLRNSDKIPSTMLDDTSYTEFYYCSACKKSFARIYDLVFRYDFVYED